MGSRMICYQIAPHICIYIYIKNNILKIYTFLDALLCEKSVGSCLADRKYSRKGDVSERKDVSGCLDEDFTRWAQEPVISKAITPFIAVIITPGKPIYKVRYKAIYKMDPVTRYKWGEIPLSVGFFFTPYLSHLFLAIYFGAPFSQLH